MFKLKKLIQSKRCGINRSKKANIKIKEHDQLKINNNK